MTDKEYLYQMSNLVEKLSELNRYDQDDADDWAVFMLKIRDLNSKWNLRRKFRNWHCWLNLFLLFVMLALVIWHIIH